MEDCAGLAKANIVKRTETSERERQRRSRISIIMTEMMQKTYSSIWRLENSKECLSSKKMALGGQAWKS